MYDSIDGKQASILKNVGSTASDSIYSHKDSVTVSNSKDFVYAETPEFKKPIVINNPICSPIPINPDYIKLAQIAYDTVLQTMLNNGKEHGDEWKSKPISYHKRHALEHAEKNYIGGASENHTDNGMTRDAMIKYLEAESKTSAINNHEEHEV